MEDHTKLLNKILLITGIVVVVLSGIFVYFASK